MTSCSAFFASQGASRSQIASGTSPENPNSTIQVISVDPATARRVQKIQRSIYFKNDIERAGNSPAITIGPGDTLEVMIWESYPPILYRNLPSTNMLGTISPTVSPMTALPPQTVDRQGQITIPFLGKVQVANKTTEQIESHIINSLAGRANQPQVIVRSTSTPSSSVTIVGEVNQSRIMPLTPKGERVLDAIAAAGGVKQPVNKMTIQISRSGQIQSLPMETIIQDPIQNIHLQAGDIITAYFQPLSFTALGASGKNDEITFEAQGIMLSQALGRVGGLIDGRSDSMGIYIFRFEDPRVLNSPSTSLTEDGKVPVVYQFDMNKPETFFAAQNFPIRNKDVLYVSVAANVELMKFLGIVTSIFAPAISINNQLIMGN